ncbi:hypothetical protein RJ640_000318 [Escallonia rubra]|uniref:Uncharacterized protein n=1 Tax=Escallonia rubra TaxID=112253 RepID=A0AA88RYB8_9ASTE|nr:hypothetical protein RJ640_000318 [Escallonia rubra]
MTILIKAKVKMKHHDLAGVKVLHGLDKVMEGGAVVLTLKDQSILADGVINQDVDMLENVEIGELEEIQSPRNIAAKIPVKIGAQPLRIPRSTTTNGTSYAHMLLTTKKICPNEQAIKANNKLKKTSVGEKAKN